MIVAFLKYLRYEKRSSEHTVLGYQRDLHQFQSFLSVEFELNELSKATHIMLRSWVAELADTDLVAKSVNRKIATLKSFYKFLMVRGHITKNPAAALKPLRVEKKLPSFVRETEMDNLLDNIPYSTDFEGQRDKLLLEVLYGTGIRLNELINLKVSDINFFQGSIKVLGKRNKERVIPIHQLLVKSIKEYLAVRNELFGGSPILLLTNSGNQLYPMFVYRKVKHYLDMVTTITKRSPHVLRHTFATHLLNKGADLNAVKDLLGHTSLAATQVYTHNSMEKLKAVFDQAHPKA